MCKALTEMLEDERMEGEIKGEIKGRKEGEKEGVARINTLIRFLVKEKRYADLEKGAEDAEYQEKLFREYNI